MMKKIPIFLLFCLCIQVLPAQQKVILENLRCRSSKGPVMMYWQNAEIRKTFAANLNTLLLKYYHSALADTSNLNIEVLFANSNFNTPRYTSKGDTANLHLYINFLENTTSGFFSKTVATAEESALIARARSVFQLQFILIKKDSVVTSNTLDIIVTAGNTPGMGILSNTIALTTRSFTEMLKAGMNILMDPENDLVQIEMKVAPAFLADNYIFTKTRQLPRVYVSTKKEISTYNYNNKTEMIRLGEAVYEEVRLKGKNADKLPAATDDAIRKTDNFSQSDFVFLRQDGRDVIRNKNYLLKLLVQVDPQKQPVNKNAVFTNFLPGNVHYLLNEKDTVAVFSIAKGVFGEKGKKIFTTIVSNGFDSTSLYQVGGQAELPLVYEYVVNGKIDRRGFSIKCSGFGNTIKEILLDGNLICIAQGKFNPEKFVIFDASLSPELLNRLFIIGFNRFFEFPNY